MLLTLDTFRRRWPAMGAQVCPELAEAILAIKPRRGRLFQPARSFHLYQNLIAILSIGFVLFWMYDGYKWAGFQRYNLLMQVFIWGSILFGARERRLSGPFSLTRFLSEGNAVLAPDIWLTGLSFAEIAATEAAVAYLRQPPLWKRWFVLLPMGLALGFVCWKFHISWASRIAWLSVAVVLLFATLINAASPLLRVNMRLRDIYAACSVENTIVRPIFTGSVSARGRYRSSGRFWLIVLAISLAMLLLMIPSIFLAQVNRRYFAFVFPLSMGAFFLMAPVFWLVLMPGLIKSAYENFTLDGQARFQQLVEKMAGGE